jgi:two-component system KDP operon response regulator KdpE
MNKPSNVVLLIDDEPKIRRFLRAGFELDGFSVLEAENAAEALKIATFSPPDLIILDLALPDLHGTEVLDRIRSWSNVPVIILSVVSGEDEKVRLLQSGADDYVVKPFGRQELAARVSALLRRASLGGAREQESDTYADAYLAVDWSQARVTVGEREVQLTPLEFRLLSTFVRHPRQVLSREQLLELVWGDAYGVGGDQVKLYVGYLRRKLDPAEPDGVPIETVRGFGYRYKAPN